MNETGRVTYVSPSAVRIFGEGCELAPGAQIRDLTPPDDPGASAGFRVIDAPNGHEALALAGRRDVKLDLLLTDMIMPGLDGREVAAGFRAVRPGVPVVGITGYAGESDQDTVVEQAGPAGLVTKPFSADALIRAVASACEGSAVP